MWWPASVQNSAPPALTTNWRRPMGGVGTALPLDDHREVHRPRVDRAHEVVRAGRQERSLEVDPAHRVDRAEAAVLDALGAFAQRHVVRVVVGVLPDEVDLVALLDRQLRRGEEVVGDLDFLHHHLRRVRRLCPGRDRDDDGAARDGGYCCCDGSLALDRAHDHPSKGLRPLRFGCLWTCQYFSWEVGGSASTIAASFPNWVGSAVVVPVPKLLGQLGYSCEVGSVELVSKVAPAPLFSEHVPFPDPSL